MELLLAFVAQEILFPTSENMIKDMVSGLWEERYSEYEDWEKQWLSEAVIAATPLNFNCLTSALIRAIIVPLIMFSTT